jgi:hypothetical protein
MVQPHGSLNSEIWKRKMGQEGVIWDENPSDTSKIMYMLLYFAQKSIFIWTQHRYQRPDLDCSTTCASHIKNTEEKNGPGGSDLG